MWKVKPRFGGNQFFERGYGMEEETRDSEEKVEDSRRDALKKAGKVAAFVIPTLVTFHLSAFAGLIPS